jgi:hypothetical protein
VRPEGLAKLVKIISLIRSRTWDLRLVPGRDKGSVCGRDNGLSDSVPPRHKKTSSESKMVSVSTTD